MQIDEIIRKVESRRGLEGCTVRFRDKVFQVYPWVKSRIFHEMMTGKEVLQEKDGNVLWLQITSLFYGWWNFFRRYDVWVFTSSAERRQLGDVYFDKLFDFAGNELSLKTWILELRLFQVYPFRKIASKYASSRSLLMLPEEVYARLFLRKVHIENAAVLQEIQQELGTHVDVHAVVRKYLAQYAMMRFLLKLRPNPKLVCLSVSYTNFGYIRAFREKGIPVVEFQHGLISEEHYAYNYRMPLDAIQFPDYLASIGQFEQAVFANGNTFPLKQVFPVGSYILDHYQAAKPERAGNPVHSIAVSLQDGAENLAILPLLIAAAKALPEVQFYLKPRRTSVAFYLEQYEFPVNIHFEETKNIYALMAACDVHTTIYSTCAVEALSLGVPNILFDHLGLAKSQLGSQLSENPFTYFAQDPADFVSFVKDLLLPRKDEVIASNSKNIACNYQANLKACVHTILNEHSEK
jgi:hypothetical protein